MYDHQLKFQRGRQHWRQLREELQKPQTSESLIRLVTEFDSGSDRFLVRVFFNEVPELWSQLAGDAIHNFRSSLDALVFAIAEHTTSNMSEREKKRLQFPVTSTIEDFSEYGLTCIAPLPSRAKHAIERLQPFNTTNWVHGAPLRALHELWNIDKHRCLLLLARSVAGGTLTKTSRDATFAITVPLSDGIVRSGDVIGSYTLPPDCAYESLLTTSAIGTNVVFRHENVGTYPNIQALIDSIEHFLSYDVFPALEPFLPAERKRSPTS